MYVIKRSGKQESIKFDKVTARLEKLSYSLSPIVNVIDVAADAVLANEEVIANDEEIALFAQLAVPNVEPL